MPQRAYIDHYDGPTTIGIDVSAYQGQPDWKKVAKSKVRIGEVEIGQPRFTFVRLADGLQTRPGSPEDPEAIRNLSEATGAGLLAGGYHYVRGYHPAEAQAELVLDVVRRSGVGKIPLAIDLEGRPDRSGTAEDESDGAWWSPPGKPKVPTALVVSRVMEMVDILRREGHRVVIYTGVAWHWHIAQAGVQISWPDGVIPELWTPYYTSGAKPKMPVGPRGEAAPWARWTLWQFAGSKGYHGRVAGIAGPVDVNRFRGGEDALRSWWAPGGRTFDRGRILDLAGEAERQGDTEAAMALVRAHYGLLAC